MGLVHIGGGGGGRAGGGGGGGGGGGPAPPAWYMLCIAALQHVVPWVFTRSLRVVCSGGGCMGIQLVEAMETCHVVVCCW
jgi:hypothetical protein